MSPVTTAGRGIARPATLLVAALSGVGLLWAAGDRAPLERGPIARPNPAARAPAESRAGGIRYVANGEPAEVLLIDSIPPTARSRILFFQGREAQPGPGGGVYTLDGSGGILYIDSRLRVQRIPVETDGRDIASVAPADTGLWLVSGDGEVLRTDRRGAMTVNTAGSWDYSLVASDQHGTAYLVRSPVRTAFRPAAGTTPLLARLDAAGQTEAMIGAGLIPADFLLTHLANAGRIAVSDSVIFFAPFIRDEVAAMTPDGEVLWISTRGLPQSRPEPRFEVIEGNPVVDYAPVNLGIALGPDGRLYVLSVPGFTTNRARLDVIDPVSGHLLRSALLDTPLPTLSADETGRVYAIDEYRMLTGVPASERQPFTAFSLAEMNGGTVSSQNVAGKVTLVNFWASWCGPCREEMPELDALQRSVNDLDFAFLTMNEDVNADAARQFVEEYGFEFPVLMGHGNLKSAYHYIGLPFTVLLDRNGKVTKRWAGYGGIPQIEDIRFLIQATLLEGATPPMPHH